MNDSGGWIEKLRGEPIELRVYNYVRDRMMDGINN